MRRSFVEGKLLPVDLPLLLFLLSALLALVPAYDTSLAWPTLIALWSGGLLYLLVSRLGGVRLAKGFTTAAGLGALLLIVHLSHDPSLDKVAVISRITALIGRVTPRLTGWIPQGNSMATLLEGLFFLAVAVLLLEKRRGWRWFWLGSVLMIGLGLLLSESRGAWLGVGLAGLVWLALYFRPARWLLALAGVGAVGLILVVLVSGDIQVLDRIPLVNSTLAPLFVRPDRLSVYQGSLYLIQDMPFTGIGLGSQFAMVYSRFVLLIQVPFLTYSHNFFLETWLELGLPGLLALVWLVASLFWPAAAKKPHDLLYEATWVGLLAMLLHGVTDARPYVDLICWLPFFLLLGLNASFQKHRQRAEDYPKLLIRPLSVAGAALVLLAIYVPLVPATWQANLGSLQHIRAELAPEIDDARRAAILDEAAGHFERSAAARPAQRTAHLRLGLIYTENRRFQEAVDHLETAYGHEPNNPVTQKALGLAYAWNGSLTKSKNMLAPIPGIADEMNTWGWWWGQQRRADLSRRAYQVSLLLNPDQPAVQQALKELPASP